MPAVAAREVPWHAFCTACREIGRRIVSTTSHATGVHVADLDVSRGEPGPSVESERPADAPEADLAETLETNLRKVGEYVEKRPSQRAAIAFAAGVVLSSLLGR